MPVVPLPMDDIVRIVVNLSSVSATRKAFDLCCIIGDNAVIPADERVRLYNSVTEMAQDGFTTESRLYKAAQLLFGGRRKPPRILVGTLKTGEKPLDALKACREINSDWYVGYICADWQASQIAELAEYIEAVTPDSVLAYTTSDASVKAQSDDSVGVMLKNKKFRRSIGQFSTKHPDAILGVIGYAMGSMTGLAKSAYTLGYKAEVGVETENSTSRLSSTEFQKITGANVNVYVNRGGQYDGFEPGKLADGTWFDELIFTDKFKNDTQLAIMDLLYTVDKIAGEETGVTQIITKITEVCEDYRRIGFVAESGKWMGSNILNLKYGDVLPNGYLIQSEPVNDQSQADRDARKSPPIYVSLKLSGAYQYITIQVDVNR